MSYVIVPISLGGSPNRGIFSPPVQERTSLELIPSLLDHYQEHRGHIDEIGFFHGGVLEPEALSLIEGYRWRLSTHPLDCSRAHAHRYINKGISTIELEALSLCDDVLSGIRAGYSTGFLAQQVSYFQEEGVRVGMVLSPGMFRSSFAHCIRTVQACIDLGVSFVRLYPVCVYKGTKLEEWWKAGRYKPLSLPETVTILREMMDRLSLAEIEVIRVGRHDAHDGLIESVAGPKHSNLRGLVEQRRFFDKITAQLCAQDDDIVRIIVHPKDVSLAKGVQGDTIRLLRARLERELVLEVDEAVPRGEVWTKKTQ